MPFSLTIDEGALAGRRYVFDQEEVSFGRTDENDVVVPNEAASRHHARVVHQDAGYLVEDMRSSNGTRVNGEPLLRPLVLEDGDVIEIGKVRFRFAPYEQVNATRIVATAEVAQWEKSRPRPPPRVALGEAQPPKLIARWTARFQELPRPRRVLFLSLGGLFLLLLVMKAYRAPPAVTEAGPMLVDRPVALGTETDPHTYGQGDDVDRIAPHGATFVFNFSEPDGHKSLLTLHSRVGSVRRADDVEVLLNGQHLQFLPATFEDRRALDLVLDRSKLLPNAENTIEFKPAKRADLSWAVSRVSIEQESLPAGTPEHLELEAREQFRLAESKYANKNVAAQNLHDSWLQYKRARLILAALAKPPESLDNLVTVRLREVDNELDRRCRQMRFTAQQARVTKGNDAVREVAEDMLSYFPAPDHPCYEQAHRLLREIE